MYLQCQQKQSRATVEDRIGRGDEENGVVSTLSPANPERPQCDFSAKYLGCHYTVSAPCNGKFFTESFDFSGCSRSSALRTAFSSSLMFGLLSESFVQFFQ